MPDAAPRRSVGRPRKDAAPVKPKGKAPNTGGPALDRTRILEAALTLIDRQGLQAFNVRELADSLKVFPTAIYWHVPSRNDLVAGAMALAMNGLCDELGDAPQGRWQDRLSQLLHRYRNALRKHPRLAPLVASELIHNSDFDAALLDHVVLLLEDAGFAGKHLLDAYNVVIAAMCGFATMELSSVPRDDAPSWEASCRAQIAAVDPVQRPALARHLPSLQGRAFMLRWASGEAQPLNSSFDAWVDVVVRGLESQARALRDDRPFDADEA